MFKFIHHIHFVVRNRDEMVAYLEKNFGLQPESVDDLEEMGSKWATYRVGQTIVDFVEPVKPDIDFAIFLRENGPGIQHVAFAVDDVRQLAKDLTANGNRLLTPGDRESMTQAPGLRPANTVDFITTSPRGGYISTNIVKEDSLGIWFSLIEA